METYSFLRQFADSWALLSLFLIFLGVVVWAFRPGSRGVHDEVANSIFRNDRKPAPADEPKSNVKEA
ncbi:cbb3-type cytochrome c oxidase subunit 3 [Pseudotabrizicola algicola]|uniref:Cbb3-type cytochrome c oxidase subunit 3 n=1 Tax=Pseudotabrizicola algicola TaxID=2709381 RepID=A0A6B3RIZ3_9RHOB|nr:cbb3-type cytochrome c oxidase subunit 3 [Pseudotabrizicola algicola]NEX46014.1 cbb3-type cytochrome c oxidase subunit 3 [Pseudotabrizicola algicola]